MIRERYAVRIVGPWLAVNADDTPPDLPEVPLGIRTQRRPSSLHLDFGAPYVRQFVGYLLHQTSEIFGELIGRDRSGACRLTWSTSSSARSS